MLSIRLERKCHLSNTTNYRIAHTCHYCFKQTSDCCFFLFNYVATLLVAGNYKIDITFTTRVFTAAIVYFI